MAGAAGYEVYRALPGKGPFSKVQTITSGSVTGCTDTGLAMSQEYAYKVRAYCLAGATTTYGADSSVKSARPVPSVPTVTAASASYSSLRISWSPVAGAGGYEVYRAASAGGSYRLVKTVTTASWSNTGLTAGKPYYYKVRAYRKAGSARVYGPVLLLRVRSAGARRACRIRGIRIV